MWTLRWPNRIVSPFCLSASQKFTFIHRTAARKVSLHQRQEVCVSHPLLPLGKRGKVKVNFSTTLVLVFDVFWVCSAWCSAEKNFERLSRLPSSPLTCAPACGALCLSETEGGRRIQQQQKQRQDIYKTVWEGASARSARDRGLLRSMGNAKITQ